MKKFLFLLSAVVTLNANATDKTIVKSTVSDVTVFAQGAQLYHKANYTISPGNTEVIIEGISPYIDAKSIQVKATGNVIILDSKHTIFYPQPENVLPDAMTAKTKKEILALEDSLRLMGYDIQELQDEIAVLNATKNIITINGAVRGQGKVNDSINLLKQTVDFYSLKMNEINKKLLALNKKLFEKQTRKSQMDERLLKFRNFDKNNGEDPNKYAPIHRIIVTLTTKENVTGKINLSYLVSNAGWVPLYDLRTDIGTNKMNLNYKAQVYQNTGLEWKDVKLTISTNNPYQNKTKPTLHPWYIDYYAYRNQNVYINAEPSLMKKELTETMVYSNSISSRNEDLLDKDAYTSADFTTVVRNLTSAEFKIDLPYTIPSNNEQHMVLIKNTDLDVKFKYFTVPKLDQSVYLVAELSKLDELGLVPAKANIFTDGSYVGETYIDPTTIEDTLSLSLGKDPNIVTKRTLLKKDSKDKILNDKIEKTMKYTIEVKNLKATPIEIVVLDQIPITQNGEITIEALNLSGGKLEERTGIVEWRFDLKTKDSKVMDFGYKVKHPKDKQVYLN
ncbi:MAG: DUF4139 domain-containing protein [Bacteroidetes bacterium]|nr:DUF4139 domain-containing protein [Bacteroidota bacterium]